MYKKIMYLKRKKTKDTKVFTTSLIKMKILLLTKMSYTNSPPKYMTTLIPKTTPLFCHE